MEKKKNISSFQIIMIVIITALFSTFLYMFSKAMGVESYIELQPKTTTTKSTPIPTFEKIKFSCKAEEYLHYIVNKDLVGMDIEKVLDEIKKQFDDDLDFIKTKIENNEKIKYFKCDDGSYLYLIVIDFGDKEMVSSFGFEKI